MTDTSSQKKTPHLHQFHLCLSQLSLPRSVKSWNVVHYINTEFSAGTYLREKANTTTKITTTKWLFEIPGCFFLFAKNHDLVHGKCPFIFKCIVHLQTLIFHIPSRQQSWRTNTLRTIKHLKWPQKEILANNFQKKHVYICIQIHLNFKNTYKHKNRTSSNKKKTIVTIPIPEPPPTPNAVSSLKISPTPSWTTWTFLQGPAAETRGWLQTGVIRLPWFYVVKLWSNPFEKWGWDC